GGGDDLALTPHQIVSAAWVILFDPLPLPAYLHFEPTQRYDHWLLSVDREGARREHRRLGRYRQRTETTLSEADAPHVVDDPASGLQAEDVQAQFRLCIGRLSPFDRDVALGWVAGETPA